MKALCWHGEGDIRLDNVDDPTILDPQDAIVRITRSAICGTDLHFIRGTMSGMKEGTILGHEGVGVVTEVGAAVRRFAPGDRVIVSSTMSCGVCWQCRVGHTAQCDTANPNGPQAGSCVFGGPQPTGPIDGLQAEYARIPRASNTLTAIPDNVSDEQAILLSDIFPTGWFGAELAGIRRGDTVAVYGAGVVGQFAIASAFRQGASRVFAIDSVESRLVLALDQNADVVNFNREDPVQALMDATLGIGVDAVIDAVGVDAQRPSSGPAAAESEQLAERFAQEVAEVAPRTNVQGDNWVPGNAPSQVARWSVGTVRKYGRIGIIGVYSPEAMSYPIGQAMNRNLTIRLGNCDHRSVTPPLLDLVASGVFDPTRFITQHEPITDIVDAYLTFDRREEGWLKTVLTVEG